MTLYLPFQEKLYSDELGCYISFGIQAIDAPGHKACSVSDVSVNRWLVLRFCLLFTLFQLRPLHLPDAVIDLLG